VLIYDIDTARLVKRIGLDGTAGRKGSFLNDIAVDEARKVAWPAPTGPKQPGASKGTTTSFTAPAY
jgi:hypothetical protein